MRRLRGRRFSDLAGRSGSVAPLDECDWVASKLSQTALPLVSRASTPGMNRCHEVVRGQSRAIQPLWHWVGGLGRAAHFVIRPTAAV